MQKVEIGARKFKSLPEVRGTLVRLSRRSPKSYFFASIIFDAVDLFEAPGLPHSDHAANDWPLGYWHKGEHRVWSESRKIRAQNAGPQCDR